MNLTRTSLVLGAALLLAVNTPARIGISLQIRPLVEESELVVAGEVSEVKLIGSGAISENGRKWQVNRMSTTVRVLEVLKGELSSQVLRLDFDENDDPTGSGPIPPSTDAGYRVLFLQQDQESYRFADRTFGALRVMPGCILPDPPAADDYARVLQRVGCALFSIKATPEEREQALWDLNSETSPAARDMFAAALNAYGAQHDAKLRQHLVASLLRAKYEPAIDMADTELFTAPQTDDTNGRLNILLGLQFVNPSRAVPLLSRALKLPQPELRQTAAQALQNTNSADAIDPLLAALDDPDRVTQFCVMQSLGSLNHELEWRPKGTEEDPRWSECLAHWHALAQQRSLKRPTEPRL